MQSALGFFRFRFDCFFQLVLGVEEQIVRVSRSCNRTPFYKIFFRTKV